VFDRITSGDLAGDGQTEALIDGSLVKTGGVYVHAHG
jgi:hypothetical protein